MHKEDRQKKMGEQVERIEIKHLVEVNRIPFVKEGIARYGWVAKNFCDGKLVLDAGCGVGYGSKLLAGFAFPNTVVGYDISEDAINDARKFFSAKNVVYHVQNLMKLKHVKNFDIVLAFEIIEHLNKKDGEVFLESLMFALKPGGLLIISTPNKNHEEHNKFNLFHLHDYSYKEFVDLLKSIFSEVDVYFQNYETISKGSDDKFLIAVCKK